jgi:hypothetical protein
VLALRQALAAGPWRRPLPLEDTEYLRFRPRCGRRHGSAVLARPMEERRALARSVRAERRPQAKPRHGLGDVDADAARDGCTRPMPPRWFWPHPKPATHCWATASIASCWATGDVAHRRHSCCASSASQARRPARCSPWLRGLRAPPPIPDTRLAGIRSRYRFR